LILYAAAPTQRFDPELPPVALGDRDLDERCAARVMVDPKGFVYRVQVEGCAPPYAAATEAALWRWVIPPADGATFSLEVRYFVRSIDEGGTGSAQIEVGSLAVAEPLAPTDPPTVPISSLTVEKRKDPDVSATMVYLSQEKGIVEVFCRVDVAIGEKGKVSDLAVHECHPDLVEPVGAAVRKWRFAAPGGVPCQATIVLPVRSFAETRGMGTGP
jgi:hypothetical protein